MQKHYNRQELTQILKLFKDELRELDLSVEQTIDHLFQFSDVVRPIIKLKQARRNTQLELNIEETKDRYTLRQYINSELDSVSIRPKSDIKEIIRPTVIHQNVETKGVMRTRIPYGYKTIYFRTEDLDKLSNRRFIETVQKALEDNTANSEIYIKDIFN